MLRISSLTKRFESQVAVDRVSLDVATGELVTLLGPSGCGKSTTLRCAAGLETPDEGEIRLEDDLLVAPARNVDVPPERRGVGMVFQSYALWPHMSVLENVAYPLHSRRLPREDVRRRARDALALVDLERYVESQPGNLSGGQQQRVALARALASDCRLLLFDEPLSNLDVRLREQMRAEIRDLQARLGITTLYVTHDQSEALAISDHIAVMEHGRVVQFGTPREVYERPTTEFVATFLGNVNLIPATALGVRDEAGADLLELAGGARASVLALDGAALGRGARKQLGLRSELMRLDVPPANGVANAWPGKVERTMFLGDSIEYVVRVPAGALKVRVPPYVRFAVGDAAVASISPEDCFVVDTRS